MENRTVTTKTQKDLWFSRKISWQSTLTTKNTSEVKSATQRDWISSRTGFHSHGPKPLWLLSQQQNPLRCNAVLRQTISKLWNVMLVEVTINFLLLVEECMKTQWTEEFIVQTAAWQQRWLRFSQTLNSSTTIVNHRKSNDQRLSQKRFQSERTTTIGSKKFVLNY